MNLARKAPRCVIEAHKTQRRCIKPLSKRLHLVRISLLCALLLTPLAISEEAQTQVIHAGKLIDVNSGKVFHEQSIVIEGDRVTAIEPGYLEHSNPIDLTGATVMPGWIERPRL